MDLRRHGTQNVFLFGLIASLCIYYVYQYFRIEELMENIDEEYEKEVFLREDDDDGKNIEPKPLPSSFDKHLLYQSNAAVEFPTERFGKPKIPHIIHYVFRNTTIPYGFVRHIRSFYKNNPKWEFIFCTFDCGRRLIKKHHPYLLETYDSWTGDAVADENRSNMIRYVLLYEYGGFTADVNVDNYRSLDIATKKYGCIVPPVPFEHSALIYNFDAMLTSAVLLCRPKHPFFKQVLSHMQVVDVQSAFDASGDGHLTRNYIEYNNLNGTDLRKKKTSEKSNSPYFYKGQREEDDNDAVYVPNTQYFVDEVNAQMLNKYGDLKDCSVHDSLQPYLTKRACAEFASRKQLRAESEYTFTSVNWIQIWTKHYTPRVLHVKKIIPTVKILD